MNKFVLIVNDETPKDTALLRLKDVDYHATMVGATDQCAGGGLFFYKEKDKDGNPVKEIHMHGNSSDFGDPKFGQFKRFQLNDELEGYRLFWHGVDIMASLNREPEEITEKIDWGFYL